MLEGHTYTHRQGHTHTAMLSATGPQLLPASCHGHGRQRRVSATGNSSSTPEERNVNISRREGGMVGGGAGLPCVCVVGDENSPSFLRFFSQPPFLQEQKAKEMYVPTCSSGEGEAPPKASLQRSRNLQRCFRKAQAPAEAGRPGIGGVCVPPPCLGTICQFPLKVLKT